MSSYLVLLQYQGSDGLHHVSEILVDEVNGHAEAGKAAIAHQLKPGDTLNGLQVMQRVIH